MFFFFQRHTATSRVNRYNNVIHDVVCTCILLVMQAGGEEVRCEIKTFGGVGIDQRTYAPPWSRRGRFNAVVASAVSAVPRMWCTYIIWG